MALNIVSQSGIVYTLAETIGKYKKAYYKGFLNRLQFEKSMILIYLLCVLNVGRHLSGQGGFGSVRLARAAGDTDFHHVAKLERQRSSGWRTERELFREVEHRQLRVQDFPICYLVDTGDVFILQKKFFINFYGRLGCDLSALLIEVS